MQLNTSSTMTPREIAHELDRHIIGQTDAKRAVAIALRNRWRRMAVQPPMRGEITPKNILMIGPTGVGKTEIARRLAKLANAPFVKIEATKFTEVGYVGRDVDSIIRDLVEVSINMLREQKLESVQNEAADLAEERILDLLLPKTDATNQDDSDSSRAIMRKKLREGDLNDRLVETNLEQSMGDVEIMAPPGMEEMTSQLQNMFGNLSKGRTNSVQLTVQDALKKLTEEEAARLINNEELKIEAISHVEDSGIVFIDEIDKVASRSDRSSTDVSREGVQRDLLPLIEGCTISTRYGQVKTDHILFIASGAFHLSRPSDLIPELQGRLPTRVELNALTPEDFARILVEPNASLTAQYQALMATEGVSLAFEDSAIQRIATLAWEVNQGTENIGARRLHTIMEKLLEEISFSAGDTSEKEVVINASYIDEKLGDVVKNTDVARFVL